MKQLSLAEIPYLAGLFDGEGTFTILNHKNGKYPDYQFTEVYITNTYQPIMQWLEDKVDGVVRMSRKGTNEHKTSYKFFIKAKYKKEILRLLLPYLIIKKRQAELVLSFIEIIEKQDRKKRGNKGLTNEERGLRNKIVSEIKSLNKKVSSR